MERTLLKTEQKTKPKQTLPTHFSPSTIIFNAHLGFLSLFPFPRFPSLFNYHLLTFTSTGFEVLCSR
ncbi:hypothetical protein P8452_62591 [Trifolium repens]|nr:hypothetical protein P8452_62591 [Trifolium repens]